jgi:hypothetical protein
MAASTAAAAIRVDEPVLGSASIGASRDAVMRPGRSIMASQVLKSSAVRTGPSDRQLEGRSSK